MKIPTPPVKKDDPSVVRQRSDRRGKNEQKEKDRTDPQGKRYQVYPMAYGLKRKDSEPLTE